MESLMNQRRAQTPILFIAGLLLCGCAAGPAYIPSLPPIDGGANEITVSTPFPDAVESGCAAAQTLAALSKAPEAESNAAQRVRLLDLPAEHICWVAEGKECVLETCHQLSPLAAIARLYEGPFGIAQAMGGDDALREAFMAQLISALSAIDATNNAAPLAGLIDGVPFADFRARYVNSSEETERIALASMLDDLEVALKAWALKQALPDTLARAEKALEEISAPQATPEELAERNKARAKAIREREQERLRAELQRRLLELQEAAERARRAAEVVRIARDTPEAQAAEAPQGAAEEESPRATTSNDDAYKTRCREGASANIMGAPPLRQTAADIYCLVVEARATPEVVPSKELKRLTELFSSLQETVFGLQLEELRWALADPQGARTLLDEVVLVPLVSKAWKNRMVAQVTRVCTDQLTKLTKSDHEDIILAEQWINACFESDRGKHRTWQRKIKTKLKDARAWQARLAAEKAAKNAAPPTETNAEQGDAPESPPAPSSNDTP